VSRLIYFFGLWFGHAVVWSITISAFTISLVSSGMAGQHLTSLFADKLPTGTSPVEATWIKSSIFLPASALKKKGSDHLSIFAQKDNWAETARDMHLKNGIRLPVVIYLHGCSGFHRGRLFVKYFLNEGFAVFAPNSFGRPGRTVMCEQGDMDGRIATRREEIKHAVSKVREIEWIDSSRLVLAGFSEGGQATSDYGGKEFMAHVVLGTDCRFSGGSPNAPGNIPVLNLVGSDDEYYDGGGCSISDQRPKGSKRVIVKGGDHYMLNSEIPRLEIAKFLKICCGQNQ